MQFREIATITYTDIKSVTLKSLKGFIIVVTDTNLYRSVFDSGMSQYSLISLSMPDSAFKIIEGDILEFTDDTSTTSVPGTMTEEQLEVISAKIVN